MAEAVRSGEDASDVARRYGLTFGTVWLACREHRLRSMSRRERAKRRQEMAEAVQSGEDPSRIARRYGLRLGIVLEACREHGVQAGANVERAKRRREAAEAVRSGERPSRVAGRLGLSVSTVRVACREHGVEVAAVHRKPPGRPLRTRTLRVIGEIMSGRSPSDIARRFDLAKSQVFRIRREAESCGLFKGAEQAVARYRSAERQLAKKRATPLKQEAFEKRVRQLRHSAGLSIQQAAAAAGVSESYWQILETGSKKGRIANPSRSLLIAMARVLGVAPYTLL